MLGMENRDEGRWVESTREVERRLEGACATEGSVWFFFWK